MRRIKSNHHEIYTYESNKTSLSDFDDKRYILDDGINTLPYPYTSLKILQMSSLENIADIIEDIRNKIIRD